MNTKLKIAHKIAPFGMPDIHVIESNNIDFLKPIVRGLDLKSIIVPVVETYKPINYSLITGMKKVRFITPESISSDNIKVKFQTIIDNFTLTLIDVVIHRNQHFEPIKVADTILDLPIKDAKFDIKVFDISLMLGLSVNGKNYVKAIKPKQLALFEIPKRESKTSIRTIPDKQFDIFDYVFPTLQPPISSKFDNKFVLPKGKSLRKYQEIGVKFLVENDKALLGDDMGLGKSIQIIFALRLKLRLNYNKVLIVCPKAVLSDWEEKLWEWAPELTIIKVSGALNKRRIDWNTGSHIYITTYETLRNDLNESIVGETFDILVLDEIQKTKNPKAGLTKSVRIINSKVTWGMSGTPFENTLLDLVTICETIKPDLFENIDKLNPSSVKTVYKDIFLRRKKSDVLKDLPDKIEFPKWLEFTDKQQIDYVNAERNGIAHINEMGEKKTLTHVFALINELKKICNYSVFPNSPKLNYLRNQLNTIESNNEKALVFSQYPNVTLKEILPKLAEFNPKLYDGSLSDDKRTSLVRNFQNDPEVKLLLLSIKSASTGITLTAANYVFHYDLWWNPAIKNQATDRAHRIGQSKKVFVYLLLMRNSIEERIYEIIVKKQAQFDDLVDDLSSTSNQESSWDLINYLFKGKIEVPRYVEFEFDSISINSLEEMDPFVFEEFTAALFKKQGFETKVTSKSKDGGIDVIAKNNLQEYIIQCKHRSKKNDKVGVKAVRELFGVTEDMDREVKGLLLTNGQFTSGAKKFAKGKIELIDGSDLIAQIKKLNRNTK